MKQKDAVVAEVKKQLPNFVSRLDVALQDLTSLQLENIKNSITEGILSGEIEYSKDAINIVEVRQYARSMVMNHLKKAKELNGGGSSTSKVFKNEVSVKNTKPTKNAYAGINMDFLSPELQELVKTLVV